MPVDYTFDNLYSLYDSFVLLSEYNIRISDACPQNVILNNNGIYQSNNKIIKSVGHHTAYKGTVFYVHFHISYNYTYNSIHQS